MTPMLAYIDGRYEAECPACGWWVSRRSERGALTRFRDVHNCPDVEGGEW